MPNFINSPALFWTALTAFFIAVFVELALRTRTQRRNRHKNAHSSRIEKILAHIRREGAKKITNDEYQKIAHVSDSTATRDLQKLVELGILKKEGRGKGTYYSFVKKYGTNKR